MISQRIILDEFSPRYAVINEDGTIVSVSSGINDLFSVSEGMFQANLTKIIKPELRMSLRSTLAEAIRCKRKITHPGVTAKIGSESFKISITVQPMPKLGEDTSLYMIVFTNLGPASKLKSKKNQVSEDFDPAFIENLERELAITRSDLDRTVQDLEASNEELKSSNEELLSMNEELQSANEELETSKEDIQNSNEALQRSYTDLENLLASTQIATLFLDNELKIKSFTPTITRIYRINSQDIGRSINDFSSTFSYMPSLPDINKLQNFESTIDDEIAQEDGTTFLRRVLLYKSHDNRPDGIVVTFIDVTPLKKTELALKESTNQLELALSAAQLGTFYWNFITNQARWSEETYVLLGHPSDRPAVTYELFLESVHPDDREFINDLVQEALKTDRPFKGEFRTNPSLGEVRWIQEYGKIYKNSQGQPSYMLGTVQDVTSRKKAQLDYERNVDNSPAILWITERDGSCSYLSKQWYELTGQTPETGLGFGWLNAVHPEDREESGRIFMDANSKSIPFRLEYRIQNKHGDYIWALDAGNPRLDEKGNFLGFAGTVFDINEEKLASKSLQENERNLQNALKSGRMATWLVDLGTGAVTMSEEAQSVFGLTGNFENAATVINEIIHPEDRSEVLRIFNEAIANKLPYSHEYRNLLPSGEVRWILSQGDKVTDENDVVTAYSGIVMDISERKKIEAALKAQSDLTKTITDNAASCLFMMDKHGHPTFMNPAAMKVTGYSSIEEIRGRPLHYAVHWKKPDGSYYPMEECPIDNAQAELKAVQNQEEIFCRKDGSIFPVSYSVAPLEKNGEVIGSVLEFRDISEEKRIQSELNAREIEFTSLANNINQLAWMTDPSGSIYWYNDRWYEYTGTTFDQMKGWGWEKVHHPDHRDRVVEFVKKAWNIPQAWELTFPLRSASGEWRWFLTRGVPHLGPDGSILKWVGTNTDITDQLESSERQKKLVQEIEFERLRFETAMKQLPAAVVLAEAPSGKLIFSNDKIEEVWGRPFFASNDVEGYAEYVGFHADGTRVQAHEWPIARSIQHGEVIKNEDYEVQRHDGRRSIVRISSAPVRDKEGKIFAGIVISQDITEMKNNELALREALHARDEFLSIASHELKTPLTSMQIMSQVQKKLIHNDDPRAYSKDRTKQVAEQFDKLCGRLSRLIEDMLDISRIKSGRLSVVKEKFELSQVVKEVVNRHSGEFIAAGCGVPEFHGEKISGVWDQLRIEQVVSNLLTNALRYGKGKPIQIKVSNEGNFAQITVKDQGIGIAKEDQEKVFQRFERAVNANEISGLGLGLFISDQIVKAHEGQIWVESELGQGSTFIVRLPVNESKDSE